MIYAYRITDELGTYDWFSPAVLACALDWPEFPIGWTELEYDKRVDLPGGVRISIAGAMMLLEKDPDRLGDLLELLVRAEVYEITQQLD